MPTEETRNAQTVIPLSMGVSTTLNGVLGFAMLIALMFCAPAEIESTLDSETSYPFMSIYLHAVGSAAGATGMAIVVILTEIFATVGVVATASRMLWAFAREGGLPFSSYIARVDERTRLPLYAIGVTALINILLAIINIGSEVGFGAFISLIVASYYASFILSAAAMLHKRLTTPASEMNWGPFRLYKWGVPLTVAAILYSTLGMFFSMWPTTVSPDIEEMNYCVLVFGSTLLFSMGFWLVYGRKHYTGPILEV
ncbi:MAG: hypothetical protein M1831_001660 [Alyxoria varia]|nr:MAG: hypothetical protein M1831_001660 [Alyxoria varia]